jgi:hypothetical protein
MDSPRRMDIVDWQDSPPPVNAKKGAPRRFLSPTLMGVLGTLLLHTMVIQSLPLGSRGFKAKPPDTQESADALTKSKGNPAASLVLVTLAAPVSSNQATTQILASSLPDLSQVKIKSRIDVDPPAFLNMETLALSENDQASKAASDNGDSAEKARLFGIYTGQIQARIDRVWRRPRTPVNEDNTAGSTADAGGSFQCQVQIIQDAAGNVQEILLPRCNGSAAWRRSLVLAIQQASPLPAPPSASVFKYSIGLSFVGVPYVSGSPEDEYELEPRAVARSN